MWQVLVGTGIQNTGGEAVPLVRTVYRRTPQAGSQLPTEGGADQAPSGGPEEAEVPRCPGSMAPYPWRQPQINRRGEVWLLSVIIR